MNKKTKVFAAYLPQYHEIEENNKFWGKGFTDWVGVRNAIPQFQGHNQPRVPLNLDYYDLSDYKVLSRQADLANKYGIDGFNIYHYWFKGSHAVLQTPAENLLNHPEINIKYFFSWDNSSWVRSWSNISGNAWAPQFEKLNKAEESPFLLECDYGNERAWKEHFEYLLRFFKDKRYFKIDNKPVFVFFTDREPAKLKAMSQCWNRMAQENGFDGICIIGQKSPFINKHIFNKQFIYYPLAMWNKKKVLEKRICKLFHVVPKSKKLNLYSYDKCWKKIIRQAKYYSSKKFYFSALVRYDDTPRRGKQANVFLGDTPEKFEKYFSELYKICCNANKEMLFITAWNEWGEGAYLEPDVKDGYGYLEAIKRVVG